MTPPVFCACQMGDLTKGPGFAPLPTRDDFLVASPNSSSNGSDGSKADKGHDPTEVKDLVWACCPRTEAGATSLAGTARMQHPSPRKHASSTDRSHTATDVDSGPELWQRRACAPALHDV